MPCLARDKSGIYYIVTYNKGKRVWRSTKTRKRSDAYRALLRAENATVHGVGARPLSDCIHEYLQHVKANFSPKTHQVYSICLKHFLEFAGNVPVEEINARLLDQYKVKRLEKVTPTTVNVETRALKTFFNCIKRWELIGKNPCEGVHQIRIPEQVPSFFGKEELSSVIEKIEDKWLRRIVLFAAMTGARRGEILNLTWDDVNLKERLVTIHSSINYRVKGGKVRTIPLNQTVVDLLDGIPDKQGLVFRGKRGEKADGNFVGRSFRLALREMGLDRRLHFHSLRHTFASLLVQNGVSLYHVQKLLGHSSSRVTEVYAHLQKQKMHDVVSALDLPPQCKKEASPTVSPREVDGSKIRLIQMSIVRRSDPPGGELGRLDHDSISASKSSPE